ncbi:hypothetical protein [Microbacterium sp. NPDC089695]|uniref:hypothetical protein n=1 Tax=Microbacterium sp. NPDC089695 TaxID=3364198 RepID=UPI0037F1C9BA
MLAMFTAVAVVIAGLTLPHAEAAAVSTDDLVAPVLDSQPSVITKPKAPSGDFAPVQAPASEPESPELAEPASVENGVDRGGLVLESRSEYQNVFVDGDGAQVVQLSPKPLNVKNDDGEWVEIDAAFGGSPDGWGVELHPLSPRIDENRSGGRELIVERHGHEVSFSLMDADAGDWESPFWFWDDWSTPF